MNKNIGTADRAIRTIAALILGYLILSGTVEGTLVLILGIVAIALWSQAPSPGARRTRR